MHQTLIMNLRNRSPWWCGLATAVLLALGLPAQAAVLDSENRFDFALADGTQIILYGEATDEPGTKSTRFYYLPTSLRLAKRADGTPEFLFLKFTTEKSAAQGGTSGAVMHFLMEWGLNADQEEEIHAKIKERFPHGQLMGAVQVETTADSGSFQVVSATMSDSALAKVITSGRAPLVAGAKAAVASRLAPEAAQLLAATFEKARSITDVSLALNYSFATLVPAARGRITFDWQRLEREGETLRADYSKTQTGTTHSSSCFFIFCSSSDTPEYTYTYDEARNQYKFLEDNKIVDVHFDETIADDRVAKVREAFFQYFISRMGQTANPEAPPPAPSSESEKQKSPEIRTGQKYTFNQSAFKTAFARQKEVIQLNYRTTVKWPLQLVGNLAEWYNGVRDNPKCVASVNLNDPFYDHRDISFILDLEAKEMFDEAINYVTVNVRKQRSEGRPFEDRVTIDSHYIQKKGINAVVTYARGEDTNPDRYEYQTQWSTKGGYVYPANPTWQTGAWEGVTLTAPVVARNIEVEADLERMKASEITRATVQIHYQKFGEEAEENIQISALKNDPLVSKRIFLDRGVRGYVYRVVLNHKKEGKLALPWSAQVGDNYIYVKIPENLLVEGPVKDQAKSAAATSEAGASEKVLGKFKELVGERQ